MFLVLMNGQTVQANEICLVEGKPLSEDATPDYRVFSCKRCCAEGCCPGESAPELTLQVKSSAILSPFIWFLIFLVMLSYIYIIINCCGKKCIRHAGTHSGERTRPQEFNLMLSIGPNGGGSERLHFDNLSTHFSVPLTPVTPPPAYVTLTPPPTYNVAVHFPPIYSQPHLEQKASAIEASQAETGETNNA